MSAATGSGSARAPAATSPGAAGPVGPTGPVADPVPGGDRRYLRQLDLYRVVAFGGVVWQHSILWSVPGGSAVGWGMVMVLHSTRETFFVLSTFVAAYAQLLRPLPAWRFWVRRLGAVLVPYVVWTAVYVVYTVCTTPSMSAGQVGSTIANDLENGYYQLYFLAVLFQVYVVLPGLLWILRRTRGHHAKILVASLMLQLAMMTISHYFAWKTGFPQALRHFDLELTTSRRITSYQLYVVTGALCAVHFAEVQRAIERHWRRIVWAAVGIGCLTEGYYVLGLETGSTPGHASDLYQPVVVVWFLAACAGLAAAGWGWARQAARRPLPSRLDRTVAWAADASGGYYLAHVLVLELVFSLLLHEGLGGKATWGVTAAVLFAGTMVGTGLLVGALMRTPLRRVLTGPDRSAERAAWPAYPASAALVARPGALGEPATGPPRPAAAVRGRRRRGFDRAPRPAAPRTAPSPGPARR